MNVYVEEVMDATGLERPEVVLIATRIVRNNLAKTPVEALQLMIDEKDIINKLDRKEAQDILEKLEEEHDGR